MTQRFFALSAVLLCACNGMTDTDTTTMTDGAESGTDTGDPVPFGFQFASDAASAYTRVDRIGMPAINTAVITSKDAYNQADPVDDALGTFVKEIVASVTGLHGALDDDLEKLKLTPCAPADCVGQAAPVVVPDGLRIAPKFPAAFPNGRQPAEPVMDVMLAVLLLDLTVHSPGLFAGLPLNPGTNDVPFSDTFPFLGAPHQAK